MTDWPPFSATKRDEYEYTTSARQSCPSCGEWVYPRRKVGSSLPFAFPRDCQVCGAVLPSPESAMVSALRVLNGRQ